MTATPADRLAVAIAALDAANAADPRRTPDGRPVEVVYAERMSAALARLVPDASEALRLAVRAQHLRRWEIPRDRYPRDRRGYLAWRTALYRHHADAAAPILRAAGYDETTVGRVGSLLMKQRLRDDPEAQALEDCACLVFLEHHLAEFAAAHDEAKVLDIIRKTWRKISPRGREAALALDLPPAARTLVERALAG